MLSAGRFNSFLFFRSYAQRMNCINKDYGIYERKEPHRIYVLLNVNCPAVLIECGFLLNPYEEKFMNKKKTREHIVNAIGESLKKYFNHNG